MDNALTGTSLTIALIRSLSIASFRALAWPLTPSLITSPSTIIHRRSRIIRDQRIRAGRHRRRIGDGIGSSYNHGLVSSCTAAPMTGCGTFALSIALTLPLVCGPG